MFLSSSVQGSEFLMIPILFFPFVRDFGAIFPSSFTRGLGFSMNWCAALFRTRFRVLDDPITSSLFHTRSKVIFFSPSTRGLEWFFSSFVRGSKMILVERCFYPLSNEIRSWSWFFDSLTWLDLHWIAYLFLFRSHTWKPIKLGSVPVLHLKS